MLQKIIYFVMGISLALVMRPYQVGEVQTGSAPTVLGAMTDSNTDNKAAPEFYLNTTLPEISAKSALVLDLPTKTILYTDSFDERLSVASLTKLMTALVAVNNVSTDDLVEIIPQDTLVVGNTMGLVVGEKISVMSLLKGLLISSSNDAALAIARHVGGDVSGFVALMNTQANDSQMHDTRFSNPVGWDHVDNYSTAHDMAILAEQVLRNPMLKQIMNTVSEDVYSQDGRHKHILFTTNKLMVQNPKVTGLKTGYTEQAMGNLIVRLQDGNRDVLSIVLGSSNREEDTAKILDWVVGVYKW